MELGVLSVDVGTRGEEDGERVSLARHGGTEEGSAAGVILGGRGEGWREGGGMEGRREGERQKEGQKEGEREGGHR